MGQAPSALLSEIEIAAPPEVVREVFLDFQSYKDWTRWVIKLPDNVGHVSQLKAGDYLSVTLPAFGFSPKFEVNTHASFEWTGSLPYIFTGRHHFFFTPSEKTPGGTSFRQMEKFEGLAAFLMGEGWSFRKTTLEDWEKFNEELKKEVERRAGAS